MSNEIVSKMNLKRMIYSIGLKHVKDMFMYIAMVQTAQKNKRLNIIKKIQIKYSDLISNYFLYNSIARYTFVNPEEV